MAGESHRLALVAIPSLVVTKISISHVAKRKGRRSWDSGPSGLLLHQTPGLAERKVGRPLKFRSMPIAYHFTVKLRTDISDVLRSSFLAGSAFLLFFTGFAVGFIATSHRVLPADRLLGYLRGVLKERTASFVGGSPVNTISMATSITPICATAWSIPSSSTSSNVWLSSLTLRLLRLLWSPYGLV